MKVHHIEGAGLADEVFTITLRTGETVTWNVTKLNAAARRGEFGHTRFARTADMPAANWSEWGGLDRQKVDAIKLDPIRLADPAIAIASENPAFLLNCFADGQHRITARQELGLREIHFWIVPVASERLFRVTGLDSVEQAIKDGGRQ